MTTTQSIPDPSLYAVALGDSVTRPGKLTQVHLQNVMMNIQSGKYRAVVEPVRNETDPDKRAELKRRLPYFCFALFNGSRAESNIRQANGIVFDLDDVPDIPETKARIAEGFPWARYIFRSSRQRREGAGAVQPSRHGETALHRDLETPQSGAGSGGGDGGGQHSRYEPRLFCEHGQRAGEQLRGAGI